MAWITITLHSDFCPGNGESSGNTIDTDICADAAGLPYCPARRLKGCLRATAEELHKMGSALATTSNIHKLFGTATGDSGCLYLQDAKLRGAESLAAWLKAKQKDKSMPEELRKAALPDNVIRRFTYVRGQTALEDGVKLDNSLRFTRVVNRYDPLNPGRELQLISQACLDSEDIALQKLLEQCCKALRHMGTHRNRGLGNVEVCYKADSAAAPAPTADVKVSGADNAQPVKLEYKIALDAPVTLPGNTELHTAIPARSVIGCLAGGYLKNGKAEDEAFKKLFLDGTAQWSALNPVIGGKISAPTPLMLVFLKNATQEPFYINTTAEPGTDWKRLKPKTLDGTYAAPTANGYEIASVSTHTMYHHQHEGSAQQDEATLYMQEALDAGQIYGGYVVLPAALAQQAIELLEKTPLRFGRSRSAQYAACSLAGAPTVTKIDAKTEPTKAGEPVYVVLQSDLVAAQNGTYTVEPEGVRAEIARVLGVENVHPQGALDYCQYHTVGGYQTRWQLQKPQIQAVRGGSVYCFVANGNAMPSQITVGEYKQEGFGVCTIISAEKMQSLVGIEKGTVSQAVPQADPKQIDKMQQMLLESATITVMRQASRNYFEKNSGKIQKWPIARLRQMLNEATDLADLNRKIGTIKESDKSSENEDTRKVSAQNLIASLYGTGNTIDYAVLLSEEPQMAKLLQADPAVQKRLEKVWKLPLELLLHQAYYGKGTKEAEA